MARIIPGSVSGGYKSKIYEDLFEFSPWLASSLMDYNSEPEFLKGYGYDTLEELLIDAFGFEDDQLKKAMSLVKKYYETIQPGDIIKARNKLKIAGYVHAEIVCLDSRDTGDCFIVATRF